MRIFGLDIVRCSKLDKQQAKQYKQIVMELYNRLLECLDYLVSLMDTKDIDEGGAIQLLFERTETISNLIIMYRKNKFAVPFTSVAALSVMNNFREHAGMLQSIMVKHLQTEQHLEDLQKRYTDDLEQDKEYQDLYEEYTEVDEKYIRTRRHHLRMLFADLNKLISVVQYDLFRVIFGVDIIRDRNCKLPKGKPNFQVNLYNKFDSDEGGN